MKIKSFKGIFESFFLNYSLDLYTEYEVSKGQQLNSHIFYRQRMLDFFGVKLNCTKIKVTSLELSSR